MPPAVEAPLQVSAAKRAGRMHRETGLPCQDAYAVRREGARVVAAVADGLGSRPMSQLGSQAACDAAVASLAAEPAWDEAAFRRAFVAARAAVSAAAAAEGLDADDLATTLQVAGLANGRLHGAMVGDGAIVAVDGQADLLLEPAPSEYANLVVPLTADGWETSFRHAEREAWRALLFTDGLTRLVLQRKRHDWSLFAPFFDAFLLRLRAGDLEQVAPRFLGSDEVDRSWDDDKCLVVIADGGAAAP